MWTVVMAVERERGVQLAELACLIVSNTHSLPYLSAPRACVRTLILGPTYRSLYAQSAKKTSNTISPSFA